MIDTEVDLADSAFMTIEHCPAEERLNNFGDLIAFVEVFISQKSIKRIIKLRMSVQVLATKPAFFSYKEDLFQLVFCFWFFVLIVRPQTATLIRNSERLEKKSAESRAPRVSRDARIFRRN